MPNPHPADQPSNRVCVKDIPDHPVGLALVETALGTTCDNSASVLTSVLEQR
jgi:hypothetical protein